MKNILLFFLICCHLSVFAQGPQTSPEKFAEFIPLYPPGNMPNSKGLTLKDSIANERIYSVGTPVCMFFPSSSENEGAAVLFVPQVINFVVTIL